MRRPADSMGEYTLRRSADEHLSGLTKSLGSEADVKLVLKDGMLYWSRVLLAQWSDFLKAALGTMADKTECFNCSQSTCAVLFLPDVGQEDMRKLLAWSVQGEMYFQEEGEYERVLDILKFLGANV